MKFFEIVAHRGISNKAPENTIEAFQHAIEVGADFIEFDIRLTADRIPIVYHYFYLDEITDRSGPIFDFTYNQIRKVRLLENQSHEIHKYRISTLEEVLEKIGGQIGLEIEIKGPEPESAEIIGSILNRYTHLFNKLEVTSYEPMLLRFIQKFCPGIITDLLLPHPEKWMRSDVVAYLAIHRARLAKARGIHLHPTQLLPDTVSTIRKKGIQIHAWDVNDDESLKKVVKFDINRVCTDNFKKVFDFRKEHFKINNRN